MDHRIRDARADDRPAIAAFTTDTFSWGDYVASAFDRWLDDPDGKLAVAVDDTDTAVALGRCAMLSPTEAWFQGARVHPDWRRRGLASEIDQALESWARQRGATVARLAVEDWNQPALAQVERIGMRPVGTWLNAHRPVKLPPPATGTNGRHRQPTAQRLTSASSAEAEPALMSWSTGELGRRARGLLTVGWTWRRLTAADLVAAARSDALFTTNTAWCLAAVDEDELEVGWLETTEEDAADLLHALLDLATERDATSVTIKTPAVDWMEAAATKLRYEITRLIVFAKPL